MQPLNFKPMNFLVKTSFYFLLSLTSVFCFAQAPANDDIVLKSMQDELARSIDKLVIQGQGKPYFIEYEVIDQQSFNATAAFGGLLLSQRNHGRAFTVDVRVGGYDFDNEPTGYPMSVAIEDDYNALRHEMWLATDAAYRGAVEQIARKRAFLKNRTDEEKIPDFSKEDPTVLLLPKQTLSFDQKQWENYARELSALFRQFPVIKQSNEIKIMGRRIRVPSLLRR